MPERIQRKRTPGWTVPEGAVYVGRGKGEYGKWGNPFSLKEPAFRMSQPWLVVDLFKRNITGMLGRNRRAYPTRYEVERELRGKDLMCWCPLDQPCHADVLLELANTPARAASDGGA